MKKGFNDRQTQLPGFEDLHESDSESDSEMELQLGRESREEVEFIETMDLDTTVSNHYQRVSCFAHTLQLCVNDGIKECTPLKIPLSKARKIVSHVRKSTLETENVECLEKYC